MTNDWALKIVAAKVHGFLSGAEIGQHHEKTRVRLINEIADLLWPGDEHHKAKERENADNPETAD